jgi:hypothetical protein
MFRSEPLENPANPVTSNPVSQTTFLAGIHTPRNQHETGGSVFLYLCHCVQPGANALHVMRNTGKAVDSARDHPVFHLIHDEPNDWQTSYVWRELKQRHILGWGNGYSWVKRPGGVKSFRLIVACHGKPHC